MEAEKILATVDHTLLSVTATWAEIQAVCDAGIKYKAASVCIPPSYVARAKEYVNGGIAICTVIGFPTGYQTTETKVFEAGDAVKNGADEIDMVINLGMLKDGRTAEVEEEIRRVKDACGGRILKVIVETCLLTDPEKALMCRIVGAAGGDFIKTSTGFSTGGATFEDVMIFAANVTEGVKIKASGGVRSFEDAEKFISLGASRLGTSALIKLLEKGEAGAGY